MSSPGKLEWESGVQAPASTVESCSADPAPSEAETGTEKHIDSFQGLSIVYIHRARMVTG